MSQLSQHLLRSEPWEGILMGNYALVRAMIEAGVRVATTFPGSPTPEIAAAITALPEDQRRMYFEYSTNEKVALEVAFGAALNGHLSVVFFKSVGLNVAADSAVQLPLMNIPGGMVVILGDDPGANSSQNEQDNRHFSRMSYMPMFEPASPTESYTMFLQATRIARKHKAAVFFRMTTHVCHARELVSFGELPAHQFDDTPRYSPANGPYMPLTELVFPLKRAAFARLKAMEEDAASPALCVLHRPNSGATQDGRRLGAISMGLPALSLLENITSSGAPVELLKLGLTYPWPSAKVEEFLRSHDEVLIVEELDRILEQELKSFVLDRGIPVKLHARVGDEELMGEMTPGRTWTLLSRIWPDLFSPCPAHEPGPAVTPRIPQMCPGCGHRSAYHAIKSALPPNAITVADIGCHTLGFFEPYDIGKVLLCMGHSTGTAAGLRLFNQERKVVCFLGDSTYFHAGIPGVVNAVANDHDITLILMENNTTAMTGHQPLASSPEQGERRISIEETLKSLNVKFIRNVDTYRQAELAQAVREAMEHMGFAVVIARHPCMLQFTKRQMRKGAFKPVQVQVDQQVCDKLHVCTGDFGCPSFVLHDDGTVTVHPDLCIGDGSCRQTCPTQALIQPRGGKDNA